MNNEFPRILSLLRKERGLTQKQVATDLDVAQALLSHYEKGKRECGLDFLVKAADYYNVSTDYLLGRSPVSVLSKGYCRWNLYQGRHQGDAQILFVQILGCKGAVRSAVLSWRNR